MLKFVDKSKIKEDLKKLVQTKQCAKYWTKFDITDKNVKFYQKVNPKFNWKVYQTPTPTLCPDCRQQRRLAFWNPIKLYRRKCELCGKPIISIYLCGIYLCDKHYTLYCQNCWRSNKG